jgi:hypothetical protein
MFVEDVAMQHRLLLMLLTCLATTPATAATDTAAATWTEHKSSFQYLGFTSFYTCAGLEAKVKLVLMHLGARGDLKVSATGCSRDGVDQPSPYARVEVTFYALAPLNESAVSDEKSAFGVMATRWTTFQLSAGRPSFMGQGECELIQHMQDMIEKGFSLRDLQYRTSCFPGQIGLADFAISGQVLRLNPQ